MEKPKQWFFNPVCKYRCEVNEDGIGLTGNEVHVIEFSAYQRLLGEAEEMLKIIKHYSCQHCQGMTGFVECYGYTSCKALKRFDEFKKGIGK